MTSLEDRFKALVEIVQNLPKDGDLQLSNEQKLKFYSFYKQATVGDVNIDQPYFFNVVERAKWDAWNGVKGMSKDAVMESYLNEMKDVIKPLSHNSEEVKKIIPLL